MLRPAPMSRITIIAAKPVMRACVETLYALEVAHLVEFSEGARPELAGFRIGKPLPEGQRASDRLVRLRGLSRHLDLAGHAPASPQSARAIEARLDEAIQTLELNVSAAAEARSRIQAQLDGLQKERALIEPLAALPLRLGDYSGYQSLAVFVGRAEQSVEAAVREAAPQAEVFVAPTSHFAVFAPRAQAGKAAEAIARAGGQLTEAPKGSGTVQERLDAIAREQGQLEVRLGQALEELARIKQRQADFLVAAEEHLTIQAEKADAPLAFATTEHAFVVEAWVPADQVDRVRAELGKALGDGFHLEVEQPGAHGPHPHQAPAIDEEGAEAHEGAEAEPEGDVPPTKLDLAGPFAPFRMFTEMVSVPRHDEIDPTPILALVLPLFLGFMIGDLGYGVLMVAIGYWLVKKMGASMPEARDIGIALVAAGVISAALGGVVFADAFGIPLGAHEAAPSCGALIQEARETTWACILGVGGPGGSVLVVKPLISKLQDIGDLLVLSVLAAFVHMAAGLGFGIVNSWSHSKRHALAKVGWLLLMIGFFAQILYMAGPAFTIDAQAAGTLPAGYATRAGLLCAASADGHTFGNPIACAVFGALALPTSTVSVIGVHMHVLLLGGLVLAAVLLAAGEGPVTVMELPTMLSNLMSYTRLAGLAIAKGAMAAAFTSLTLVAMVYSGAGGIAGVLLVIVGLVLFVLTQAFVFVLGVFSSSIQAIRLNFVEFFNKFYQGGGVPFTPFGRKRKFTQEA